MKSASMDMEETGAGSSMMLEKGKMMNLRSFSVVIIRPNHVVF